MAPVSTRLKVDSMNSNLYNYTPAICPAQSCRLVGTSNSLNIQLPDNTDKNCLGNNGAHACTILTEWNRTNQAKSRHYFMEQNKTKLALQSL